MEKVIFQITYHAAVFLYNSPNIYRGVIFFAQTFTYLWLRSGHYGKEEIENVG